MGFKKNERIMGNNENDESDAINSFDSFHDSEDSKNSKLQQQRFMHSYEYLIGE